MSEKRRVVIFRNKIIHTGGDRYLAEVHDYLNRQGIKVIPIWVDERPKWPGKLGLIADCLISNLWMLYQATRHKGISDALFFEDFHLHPRLFLFNALMRLTKRNFRSVVLMQLSLFYHDALKVSIARRLDEHIIRLFFSQSQLVLCNSEFTRNEVVSFGVSQERTRLVYCGCKLSAQPESALRRPDAGGILHLLFVGQCASYKGIEYLIRALYMLQDINIMLDIVGNTAAEPEYFSKMTCLVNSLGLAEKVIFHGNISDRSRLDEFYTRSDIFVLPSLAEGFGIVLLEAMSFGLPIIATNAGAIPELVRDGINGLVVPPSDPAALAKAIRLLAKSPELREQYGREGLSFVTGHRSFYSWKETGERVFKAIEPLMKDC